MADSTRQRLLDAALTLTQDEGLHAVTHRTVEERAGVARGSTRYHFGTRDGLVAALLAHVAELDQADIVEAISRVAGPAGLDALAVLTPEQQNLAMQQITAVMLEDPRRLLARFELYLHAARHPELADQVAQWREGFVAIGAPHLAAVGAADGSAAARLVIASMEGLMLHALSSPHPDFVRWGPEWTGLLGVAASLLGSANAPLQWPREP
ncbi:TetR/AcrR family transcriptional regulator [Aestuariimicrobium ganziense]|uniref:TetR/AcrR family transcriptional regulator n=1 Tax=Aestuariimicrobium ganziense TaxID=2773677 RepID=UPI00194585FD|nr:TetR family transcriptional regulator [Aestuariimicrobium ganziense]